MATTHIEVLNSKGLRGIQNGQLLKVVKETTAFFWVQGFEGHTYKVSKKTKKIIDINNGWLREVDKPTINF